MRVVIAGGGLIGLTLAWRLAQNGVTVSVVEAGRAGGEASWAGAGMLAPGGEIDQENEWTRFTLHCNAGYRQFAEELAAESGASTEWRASGAVELAANDTEWEELDARAGRQTALGIPSEVIDHAQLLSLVPGLASGDWRARWFPQDAVVNPRKVTAALLQVCANRGVVIHENRTVLRVDRDQVHTSAGKLPMDAAVISAGAWSNQIAATATLPVTVPVRGHLIGFAQPQLALGPILRHGHTYLLQRKNGMLIAGASEERTGFDRNLDPAIAAGLATRAAVLLPALAGKPYEAWLGFRPGTPTGHPVIRRAGPRLWLAYGHYRNGILQAPGTADRIAAEMLSARAELALSPSAA